MVKLNKYTLRKMGQKRNPIGKIYRTRGLYFFYPIFYFGLYFRAVYTAESQYLHETFLSLKICGL